MPRFLSAEPVEAILGTLGDALDLVDFGVVLLNSELRACFLNRRAHELCKIDPEFLSTAPGFREMIDHAAAKGFYDVEATEMTAYLDEREAEVRSGTTPPRLMNVTDGRQILFRCVACPDGGRILTYADISDELHAMALQTTAQVSADLRFTTEVLEEQGANLATLAEASEENAQKAESARLLLEHEIGERRELEVKLRRLATTDGLTGAFNRGELLAAAQREIDVRRDLGSKVVVLMIDVDHFKSINDRFGHAGGDLALQSLVTILRAGLRQHDIVGRLGGEEFAVVLLDTPSGPAEAVAERLRVAVSETPIRFGEQLIPMTISVGLAVQQAAERSIEQVVGRADGALYSAKRSGRNRVVTDIPAEVA